MKLVALLVLLLPLAQAQFQYRDPLTCQPQSCDAGTDTSFLSTLGINITNPNPYWYNSTAVTCIEGEYSDGTQCHTCSACASGQYRSGCGGSSAGTCTLCPSCVAGTRRGCAGLSEGSCVLDDPDHTISVTVTHDGTVHQLTIPDSYLIRGQVYRFTAPDETEHPIYIRHADGTPLTVHSLSGYSASSGAVNSDYVQFTPQENIELFCTNHASMVTPIPVYDEAPQQNTIGGVLLSLEKQTELRNRASQKRENIRRKTAFANLRTQITNVFDEITSRAKRTDMASYKNNAVEQRVSLLSLDLTTKTLRETIDMKRALIAQMKASKTEARIPVRFSKSELNLKPSFKTILDDRGVSEIVAFSARTDTAQPSECNGEYVEIADIQPGEHHECEQDDVGQIALNCWDGNMLSYTELTSIGVDDADDQYDVYCYENNQWVQIPGTFVAGNTYTCNGASEERYRTYEHVVGSNGGGEASQCTTSAPSNGQNCVESTLYDGQTCTQTCDSGYTSNNYEATCSSGTFTPITCDVISISGCTDSGATNYNRYATSDNDSCEYDDNTRAPGQTCAVTADCTGGETCTVGVCECIEVGQRVLMADGTHKNVEHLVPGDMLRTPDGTTAVRSTRRGGRHLSAVHDVECAGKTGAITGNHAYHCEGEWRLPQETHEPRALTGTTEVVAVETDNYCEDRMILEGGLHVETWDGRGIDEWRPHSYENGRRLRCTLKGTWRDRVLKRVDSKQ